MSEVPLQEPPWQRSKRERGGVEEGERAMGLDAVEEYRCKRGGLFLTDSGGVSTGELTVSGRVSTKGGGD